MKKKISKLFLFLFLFLLTVVFFCACNEENRKSDDIYIVYTGDVHCAYDQNLGYATLKAYKEELQKKSDYVLLVDTGDAMQGDFSASLTKGAFPLRLMNQLPYDYAVLGNHDFDYGIDSLRQILSAASATYLGCNLTYLGTGDNVFAKLKPYILKECGDTKIGLIGLSTPQTLTSSRPTIFVENDKTVYDFCGGTDNHRFTEKLQETIDQCKKEGADYIIAMGHLGDDEPNSPFSSREVIAATEGIDVFLDGHAHHAIPCDYVENKNKELVLLSSTGEGLKNIGTLLISKDGSIQTSLVSGFPKKDATITETIEKQKEELSALQEEVVGSSDFALSISENGIRRVRNSERGIGNFVADAVRFAAESDIAIINGGGIRADLPKGDITYADICRVLPFNNTISSAYVTGSQIADALELGYRFVDTIKEMDGQPYKEEGGFLQLSGLRCCVDTSIPSSVVMDENGFFVGVEGERRVKRIEVEKNGEYLPLDLEADYLIASFDFLLIGAGDGYSMFAQNEPCMLEGLFDHQSLILYLDTMGGKIDPRYEKEEGRITIY